MPPSPEDVTALLAKYRDGDGDALNELLPIIYDELRKIARRRLRRERQEHTLQATALVHEAYLRLADQKDAQWQSRAHFIACAARIMRNILVDNARSHGAEKRGGGMRPVTLEAASLGPAAGDPDVLALDDALRELEATDPVRSRVVELRYFGGLSIEEVAEVMQVSTATVKRQWTTARAWLHRELSRRGSA
jgi:RNA polymerase sigma factor (TIGR02999 family)